MKRISSQKRNIIAFFVLMFLCIVLSSCSPATRETEGNDKETFRSDGYNLIKTSSYNRYITVDLIVTAYGTKGNGISDDSDAIQKALNDAALSGGGNVFLPRGKYRLTKQITIPENVSLYGYYISPTSKQYFEDSGTTIICEKNDETLSEPLFLLSNQSKISDVTIVYETQDLNDPVEYPYTICQSGGRICSVSNVTLLNSWNGMLFDSEECEKVIIENVYITSLNRGITVNRCYDTTIIENVNFSPVYYLNSNIVPEGSENISEKLSEILSNGLVAFSFNRISDLNIYSASIDTSNIGIFFDVPAGMEKAIVCSNITITNSQKCINIKSLPGYGAAFAQCSFRTTDEINSCAIYAENDFSSSVVFNSCSFSGQPDKVIVSNGTGNISIINSRFSGWRTVCQEINNGVVSSSYNTFIPDKPILSLSDTAKGFFYNNSMSNDYLVDEKAYTDSDSHEYNISPIDSSWVTYKDEAPNIKSIYYYGSDYNIKPENRDNYRALQNLIDSISNQGGGIIVFEEGEYHFSSPITIKRNVMLFGATPNAAGSSKTILSFKLNEDFAYCINMDSDSALTCLSIKTDNVIDYSLIQDLPLETGYAVFSGNTGNIYIDKINLMNLPNGIYLKNVTNGIIKNVEGTAGKYGITADICTNIKIKRCSFDSRYSSDDMINFQLAHFIGFKIIGGKDINVINCNVENSDYGVEINSMDNNPLDNTPFIVVNGLKVNNCYAAINVEKSSLAVFINIISYSTVIARNAYGITTTSESLGNVFLYNMICGGKATANFILRGDISVVAQGCILGGNTNMTFRILSGYLESWGNIIDNIPNNCHISAESGVGYFISNIINSDTDSDSVENNLKIENYSRTFKIIENKNITMKEGSD